MNSLYYYFSEDIYIWQEQPDGSIKKVKTDEKLHRLYCDPLYYCRVCGKRFNISPQTAMECPHCHSNLAPEIWPNRDGEDYFYCSFCKKRISDIPVRLYKYTCPVCHSYEIPYETMGYWYYDGRFLQPLKEELQEPHLNIDDIIIEDEVSKLPSFKNGLTYKLVDRYCAIYCADDVKIVPEDEPSEYEKDYKDMETGEYKIPIYVWVRDQNGNIEKMKTPETLEVYDSDYLYYCPTCGARTDPPKSQNNKDIITDRRVTCPECGRMVLPVRSKYTYDHYAIVLKDLKKKLEEPNLNVDDIIREEEIPYVHTFEDGEVFLLDESYKALYVKWSHLPDEDDEKDEDEEPEIDDSEQSESPTVAYSATTENVDIDDDEGDTEYVCPVCGSKDVIGLTHALKSPLAWISSTDKYDVFVCENCGHRFSIIEAREFLNE